MGASKTAVLNLAKQTGLFRIASRFNRETIPVLCYHGLWTVDDGFPGDAMFMRAETFPQRLDAILRHGFTVVSLDDALDILDGDREGPANPVVITIDDGWLATFSIMLPELQSRSMPATLYCDSAQIERGGPVPHVMARYVRHIANRPESDSDEAETTFAEATDLTRSYEDRLAATHSYAKTINFDLTPYLDAQTFHYMSPDQLREFASSDGMDVQLHTHNHTMHDFSTEALEAELNANKTTLGEITRKPETHFRHFCYPSGECSQELADWLAAQGYRSTTTTAAGLASSAQHRHLLPRIIDGNQRSPVDFEAEIRGIAETLRNVTGRTQSAV